MQASSAFAACQVSIPPFNRGTELAVEVEEGAKEMCMRTLTAASILVVIATVCMYADMAEAEVVTEGLVSYWTFDETDTKGKIVTDVWGNNNGTITGGAQIVEGKVREAIELDGLDGYVDCGKDKSLDIEDAITIEVWMKALELQSGFHYGIVSKRDDCGGFPYQLFLPHNAPADRPVGFHNGGQLVSSEEIITDNDWHHVAFTLAGGKYVFYVDGEESGKGSTEMGAPQPATLKMGWDSCRKAFAESEGNFNGTLDEVRIYDRALSEAEITQNFAAEGLAVAAGKLALTWGWVKLAK